MGRKTGNLGEELVSVSVCTLQMAEENPGHSGEKPVTNRLSHDKAFDEYNF
jgi:hypothetical protein